MKFSADERRALNRWLSDELVLIVNIDPTTLADYTVGLLETINDVAREEGRTQLEAQLESFLSTSTPAFVRRLQAAVLDKSYLSLNGDGGGARGSGGGLHRDDVGGRGRARSRSRSRSRSRTRGGERERRGEGRDRDRDREGPGASRGGGRDRGRGGGADDESRRQKQAAPSAPLPPPQVYQPWRGGPPPQQQQLQQPYPHRGMPPQQQQLLLLQQQHPPFPMHHGGPPPPWGGGGWGGGPPPPHMLQHHPHHPHPQLAHGSLPPHMQQPQLQQHGQRSSVPPQPAASVSPDNGGWGGGAVSVSIQPVQQGQPPAAPHQQGQGQASEGGWGRGGGPGGGVGGHRGGISGGGAPPPSHRPHPRLAGLHSTTLHRDGVHHPLLTWTCLQHPHRQA